MPEPLVILEAVLFASDTPVEAERIRDVLDLPSVGDARALVTELQRRYEGGERGLQVVEVGGGFRMVTRPELAPWLVRLARSRTRARLSRAALETLAIVGYRQPISRPEIDAVRGVSSEGVLESLLERRLLRIAGRKDAPGRPFLYETTREFLVAFGLRDLGDLPPVEGELIAPEPPSVSAEALSGASPTDTPSAALPSGAAEGDTDARAPDDRDLETAPFPTDAAPVAAHENPAQHDPGESGTEQPPGR